MESQYLYSPQRVVYYNHEEDRPHILREHEAGP